MRFALLVPLLLVLSACEEAGHLLIPAAAQSSDTDATRRTMTLGNDQDLSQGIDVPNGRTIGLPWDGEADLVLQYGYSRSGFHVVLRSHSDGELCAALGDPDLADLVRDGSRCAPVPHLVLWTNHAYGADAIEAIAQRAFELTTPSGEHWAGVIDDVDVREMNQWEGSATVELSLQRMDW